MADTQDTLLRVEHLCQYFKVGGGFETKAVDDVSFDIKKGEVFGLVGESFDAAIRLVEETIKTRRNTFDFKKNLQRKLLKNQQNQK